LDIAEKKAFLPSLFQTPEAAIRRVASSHPTG
jgi:hypothetical protein